MDFVLYLVFKFLYFMKNMSTVHLSSRDLGAVVLYTPPQHIDTFVWLEKERGIEQVYVRTMELAKTAQRLLSPIPTLFLQKILVPLLKNRVPGISIAIIKRARIAWCHTFGVKNSQTQDTVCENTIFEAASLSKPVFAYGIFKLIEKGILELDRPLVDYLPRTSIEVEDERINLITARIVLTHTTGFPNWRPRDKALAIHFQPGERFSYSGEGFAFLQKVLEHVTSTHIDTYFREQVFVPLRMNHSTFEWVFGPDKASGHDSEGVPLKNPSGLSPNAAFTLHTNARDYARFMVAIMRGNGLQATTVNEMLQPCVPVRKGCVGCLSLEGRVHPLSSTVSWGLGWGIQRTSIGDSFWHWGDNGCFKNFVVGFQNHQSGVVAFSNSKNGLKALSEVISSITHLSLPAVEWLESAGAFER